MSRQLQVLYPYRSRTLGTLERGLYAEETLRTMRDDLPEHLIRMGCAQWYAPEPDMPLDLERLTRDDLADYAARLGIDVAAIEGSGANGHLLKADLIAAIGRQA